MLDLALVDSAPALHPHLLITPPASRSGCIYNVSLSLPDAVFIDRDEISDLWPRDQVAWSLSPDKIDIERPVRDTVVEGEEGVHFSVQLGPEVTSLDVPLHTRYLRPNWSGRERVDLFVKDKLQAGWACGGAPATLESVQHAPLSLDLPTGHISHQALVQLVTPVVIWLGWTHVVGKIRDLHRRSIATTKPKTA